MASPELDVWQGTPSQVINLGTFAFALVALCLTYPLSLVVDIGSPLGIALAVILVLPLFRALWRWLVVKNIRYELTSQRLKTHTGVFNKSTDELELYRVRDYRLDRPFFLRLFALGNVVLITSDKSNQTIKMRAIRDGHSVRESIRNTVEELRERKEVREVDFE
ncbi:MAG TPA: PH domain-containing protein [Gammaproteobacteria bacterium]